MFLCTLAYRAGLMIPEHADGIDKGDLQGQGHEFEVDDLYGWPDIIIGFQGGEITLSRNQSLSAGGRIIPLRIYVSEPFCHRLRQES